MVVFITSVRHPRNSHSYSQVLSLLKATLKSVCAQTDEDFRVIVVANQVDDIGFSHPNIEWVIVDFPAPSGEHGPKTGISAVRRDKGCKYAVALCRAKEYAPDYIMFFDADDFVNRKIAAFCNGRKGQNGWYVDRGYVWRDETLIYGDMLEFYKWCGTCNILNFQLLVCPDNLSIRSSREEIEETLGEEFVHKILGAHPFTVGFFAANEVPLVALPFPGAVYLRGTNENHSGLFYGSVMSSWPKIMDREFCRDFGIDANVGLLRRTLALLLEWPRETYRVFRYRADVKPPV